MAAWGLPGSLPELLLLALLLLLCVLLLLALLELLLLAPLSSSVGGDGVEVPEAGGTRSLRDMRFPCSSNFSSKVRDSRTRNFPNSSNSSG